MVGHHVKQVGLPPGSLIHIGEVKTARPTLSIIDFSPAHHAHRTDVTLAECLAVKESPWVSWINLYGIHDVELLRALGEGFGIHPLALEDILDTAHRPKIETFDDYTLIILKMLSFNDEQGEIETEQFSFIFGENYVLSFQERPGDVFNAVRERLQKKSGRIRSRGSDYLVYALIDSLVDHYFHILEKIGDHLDILEQRLIEETDCDSLNRIHFFKKELLLLRKAIWPLRDVTIEMLKDESDRIHPDTHIFLRDLHDHVIKAIDSVELFRDTTSSLLDLYMSISGNRMNEVMKVLTIMASIFIPLTFIAGVYGMNFELMPELKWRWGYPAALILMASSAVGLLIFFKRKRWL
ncbi:MAG: magnesium/cobalt transporter CorA [Desulfuromonadaceae bacterium]|nr:magnesium/cobalt transporter CorA [Desulfuromonadaceae bacterium]